MAFGRRQNPDEAVDVGGLSNGGNIRIRSRMSGEEHVVGFGGGGQ
jgi:hypothetical protein